MSQNLLKLIQGNLNNGARNWRVDNDASTLYVYDVIGGYFGGVDALEMVKAINAMDTETITVRVNSPGGDVFDGRSIASALSQHKAKVIVYIDGLAASAATTIAMAGDEVHMAQGSRFMIHNAWTLAIGNKSDMLNTAELLEKLDNDIAGDYVSRSGNTPEQVREWMDAETWFSADEAVEKGFANSVVKSGNKQSNTWNLSAYKNAPKEEPKQFDDVREVAMRRLSIIEKCPA